MTVLQVILTIRKMKRMGFLFKGRKNWSISSTNCPRPCSSIGCYQVFINLDGHPKDDWCALKEWFTSK